MTGSVRTSHLPPTDPSTYPSFIWELDHRNFTIPADSKIALQDGRPASLIHPAAPEVLFPAWAATTWRAMSEIWNARDVWVKGFNYCRKNSPSSYQRDLQHFVRVHWYEAAALNSDLLARCQQILGDNMVNDESLNDCVDVLNATLDPESRPIVVTQTGFCPFVLQEKTSERVLRKALRKLGNKAHGQIIIPWHLPQSRHWVTVRLDLDTRMFVIVDSLRGAKSPDKTVWQGVQLLGTAIDKFLGLPDGSDPWIHDATSIASPRQRDGISCGPITLNTMQRMLYNDRDIWTPERAVASRMEVMDGCVKCWELRGSLARTKTQHVFGKLGFFNPAGGPAVYAPGDSKSTDGNGAKTPLLDAAGHSSEGASEPDSESSERKAAPGVVQDTVAMRRLPNISSPITMTTPSDSSVDVGKPLGDAATKETSLHPDGMAAFRQIAPSSDAPRPVAHGMAAFRQFAGSPNIPARTNPDSVNAPADIHKSPPDGAIEATPLRTDGMAAFQPMAPSSNLPRPVAHGMAAFHCARLRRCYTSTGYGSISADGSAPKQAILYCNSFSKPNRAESILHNEIEHSTAKKRKLS
ncbi:uncharacterized protein BXZ73DRAFT_82416 [Epithele typhae]|uniref:uncharacterized protein n=1 Tax=Epithele typhae TaxID=378194 RepID=UPI0020076CC3|nr:uncharacterized protein BXZ73DRAFT_82416 [Epithele typhae]KAH9912181.1 hypothetical protein BXZ73DRAFT_82416 [Epithele typhae]